jgi:superfamily II DNA or RNA helicase
LATVGFYVGGMKQSALKESETKRIILATFAMAEEALDIKTLSTLILATPKNDVTQAVGRILRVKHEKPVVIDIVDPHTTFVNQWKKRRAYYNSQGYTIVESNHATYPRAIESKKAAPKCLLI